MSSAKVSEKKIESVKNLKEALLSYPIIGLVRIDNINARVVQQIRKDLRKEAKIIMAKNSLMKIALSEVKKKIPGIEKLNEHIIGSCAFLVTDTNPYKLASFMNKNKVPAPAKAGQIAPNDVIIRPMNTGIPPGPVIAELQSLGLKTRIEGGQIRIVEEAVITQEGERVNRTVAHLLGRLNIDPFEAGLSFIVAFEKGTIIPGDELLIDYDVYEENLKWAYSSALNLAINAGIVTKQSLPLILANVYQKAINLSVSIGFLTTKTIDLILAKANSGALSIAGKLLEKNPDAVSTKIQERIKQTPKPTTIPKKVEEKLEEKEAEEEEEPEEDLGLGSLFG
jgi:large subunit ribosomal protein L10